MSTASHRQIEAAAGDWLARRDSGAWTDADQVLFDRWMNESVVHRVAYLRLEDVWERAQRLQALGAGVPTSRIPEPGQWVFHPFFSEARHESPRARSFGLIAAFGGAGLRRALAAGVLLAIAVGASWYWHAAGPSYRTPVGGLASVSMADGSEVTLNTNSEIRVAVSERERRVELQQGEAFFEVAKDSRRPFVVVVGNKRVIAVGTRFSVRRDDEDIEVVVTEGKIRLESAGSPQPVAAGTIAHASDTGVLLQKTDLAAAEEVLSWRKGILVFHEITLADAIAEFNRYNTHKISIADPGVASLRVAGTFRANNVNAFVRLLERGYPLRVERKGEEFVLQAR